MKARLITQLVLFILPWSVRRLFLKKLLGYNIDKSARIGLSIVLSDNLEMKPHARIGSLTLIKNIDNVSMGEYASISSLNIITGFNTSNRIYFLHNSKRKCELVVGRHARITSRHMIDCNGGIYVDEFTTIAGIRSQILTHSIDVYNNRQDSESVHIGKYCFIGTGVIILKGVKIPDYVIIAAGSVVNKSLPEPQAVYAGNPAKLIKKLNIDEVAYFRRSDGLVK